MVLSDAHLCFSQKKAVFTLDLLIFDPLFQTPDAHLAYSKDHLDRLSASARLVFNTNFQKKL